MKKLLIALALVAFAACAYADSTNTTGTLFINQNVRSVFTDGTGTGTEQAFTTNFTWSVVNGISTNQMNVTWSDSLTLIESATKSYDLAGGLTNRFGKPITFTGIKWLQLMPRAANVGSIKVGDGLATLTSLHGVTNGYFVVRPGSGVMFLAPQTNNYAVTATTADILKFTNLSGNNTNQIDIFIGGTGN